MDAVAQHELLDKTFDYTVEQYLKEYGNHKLGQTAELALFIIGRDVLPNTFKSSDYNVTLPLQLSHASSDWYLPQDIVINDTGK